MKKALNWWEKYKDELISKEDVENMLKAIVPALEKSGIDYWLGRGTLRDLLMTGEIGDKSTDVDFHICHEDKEKLIKALETLVEKFNLKIKTEKPYKIAFENRPKFYFEFMFLRKVTDPRICYHERRDGKRFAPLECFSSFETYDFKGLKIRIPKNSKDYLKCVYGPKWEERNYQDKKFSNSLEICNEIVNK